MGKIDVDNSIFESSFPGIGNTETQTLAFTIPSYSVQNIPLQGNIDLGVGALSGASDFLQIQALFSPLDSRYVMCDTLPSGIETTLGGYASTFRLRFFTSSGSLIFRHSWFTSSPGAQTTPVITVSARVFFYLPLF